MNNQPILTPPEMPDENKWETAVQDRARQFAYPPTPDIAANTFHSGSISKSQCDRLLGSFHNMTASTISTHRAEMPATRVH